MEASSTDMATVQVIFILEDMKKNAVACRFAYSPNHTFREFICLKLLSSTGATACINQPSDQTTPAQQTVQTMCLKTTSRLIPCKDAHRYRLDPAEAFGLLSHHYHGSIQNVKCLFSLIPFALCWKVKKVKIETTADGFEIKFSRQTPNHLS